jgi:amino acid transporter
MKRVLGVPSLVLLGLVYMVPLTIFSTYGIVVELTDGRLTAAYAVTLVVMLFTARSYGRMARVFPTAGSAYTYGSGTFGPGLGFLTGWSLMLDYLLLPMINYLLIGIYLSSAFPAVPPWVFILVSVVLITALNIMGITTVARANVGVIGVQGVFIVLFAVLAVNAVAGAGPVDLLAPFTGIGADLEMSPVFAGAAILCLSFLGFDAVSTFAEEAKDPRRTIPRAIMLTTFVAGLLFLGLAFLSQLALPVSTFANVDSAALEVVARVGGSVLQSFFMAGFIAGSLGSALTSQASVSRIIFSMGRDGVLPPRVFGTLHPRLGTPLVPILLTSAISLLSLVLDLTTISSLISFGALVAFSVVNLSVIKHFFFDRGERGARAILNNLVLPGVGFALTLWLWTSLTQQALVLGAGWAALGLVYLAFLTRGFRRPTPQLNLEENGAAH